MRVGLDSLPVRTCSLQLVLGIVVLVHEGGEGVEVPLARVLGLLLAVLVDVQRGEAVDLKSEQIV